MILRRPTSYRPRDWRRRRCTSELERGSSDLSQHVARKWKRESSEATQTRENLVERLVAGQAGKHDMSRYDVIFVQDRDAFARPGAKEPLGRIDVTRSVTGGDLHSMLTSPG